MISADENGAGNLGENYYSIFQQFPDAAFLARAKDGILLDVNQEFEQMTGYCRSEVIGHSTARLLCWLDPAHCAEASRVLDENGEVRDISVRVRRRDGTSAPVLMTQRRLLLNAESCYLGSCRGNRRVEHVGEKARSQEEELQARLDTLLSPDTDIGKDISEIIDLQAIQRLMDSFYKLTRIGIGLIDVKGNILVATGWQDICTKFHRKHPQTLANCIKSDTILSLTDKEQTCKVYKCKNNMWDIATPITVQGRHVANLFLGQFLFEEEVVDREVFVRQAEAYGFDQQEYLAALDRIPRWSRETVNDVIALYTHLARMVTELSYRNIRLSKALVERKRATKALRESEAKFVRAFSATPSLLTISTRAEGRFLEVNESFERLIGYRREEAIGRTAVELKIWEAEARDRFLEEISKEGQVRDFEITLHSKSGDRYVVLMSAEIVEMNGVERVLTLAKDITQRKLAEEQVRQLNEVLEARVAERTTELEAINRELESFCYTISHDLRAPLRAIDGYTRILSEDHEPNFDDEGRSLCKKISGNAVRMGRLIDDLLAFSRIGRAALKAVPVDMTALVRATFDQVVPGCDRGRIELRLAPLPPAIGDLTTLRQVWCNLIDNAVKYSSVRPRPVIVVGGEETETETIYYVRDNGAGFDMAYVDKLFTVFQRLHSDREFPGTGVGLAIVKRVIQRHGGRNWAEGKVDEGATIYFSLPLHPGDNRFDAGSAYSFGAGGQCC